MPVSKKFEDKFSVLQYVQHLLFSWFLGKGRTIINIKDVERITSDKTKYDFTSIVRLATV